MIYNEISGLKSVPVTVSEKNYARSILHTTTPSPPQKKTHKNKTNHLSHLIESFIRFDLTLECYYV